MMGWRRESMARIVPFVLFMAFLALRGFVADHPAWGIDARWIYGVGVMVVAASLVFYARDYAELGRGSAPSLIHVLIAAAVGAAVFWMWIHLDRDWMQQDHWTRLIGLGGKAGEATATFTPVDAQGHILWPLVIVRWIGGSRPALLCVERDPEACHRSLIAARLARDWGFSVADLRPS